jgi:hypothetical protein
MARANENEDEHKEGEQKTSQNLLALEFHFCW